MGELVHQRDLQADRDLRAPYLDALVGGVVEGERPGVGHGVVGLEEVDLAGGQAEGAQLGGVAIELGLLLVGHAVGVRSEEHTSELQSLMRISYAVFCLKKNNN